MALYPITEYGSTGTRQADLLTYAERDTYGVEAPAASPAEPNLRGANKILSWLRRAETALLVEHYASGRHNTVKIARAVIELEWDGISAYTVGRGSYVQDTTGETVANGSNAATVSIVAAGHVQVTLDTGMPSDDYRLVDYTRCDFDAATDTPYLVRCSIQTITSSTVFRVYRYRGSGAGAMSATHGDMFFEIHE